MDLLGGIVIYLLTIIGFVFIGACSGAFVGWILIKIFAGIYSPFSGRDKYLNLVQQTKRFTRYQPIKQDAEVKVDEDNYIIDDRLGVRLELGFQGGPSGSTFKDSFW